MCDVLCWCLGVDFFFSPGCLCVRVDGIEGSSDSSDGGGEDENGGAADHVNSGADDGDGEEQQQ